MSVDLDQIVVSDKFKHNNESFKFFIGYYDGLVRPLCIILPQMSGYIKYFENGGKNMSFLIKDDEVWDGVKFDGVIKTNFLGNGMPKENMYYTCFACITIDSVMNINKKNLRRV